MTYFLLVLSLATKKGNLFGVTLFGVTIKLLERQGVREANSISHFNERSHDGNIDLHSTLTSQYARKHGNSLLCERRYIFRKFQGYHKL